MSNWPSFLGNKEARTLCANLTRLEVKKGLGSLKPLKAPGPDGIHVGFFQAYWQQVGTSVINEVFKVFQSSTMPPHLNETLITLIPKHLGADCLASFRPISLCNTVYKVVTMIIVKRLRPFLPKLISPLQTTFVSGRMGLDNMIITQELIHTMMLKKGKTGCIKIDLEKAYDRLEWPFIRDVLELYRLPPSLIKLIMSCVSSSSVSILLNGGKLEPFHPSRGIRQGDPLSPYLFIMCMVVLGFLISWRCEENLWDLVQASRGGQAFSYIFFADDLVLFAKAYLRNCISVRETLDTFCEFLGKIVSLNKSKVYFSLNTSPESREEMCEVLGMHSTPNLGKYLGFPIKHPGSTSQDINFVVERVQNKLQGWKTNLLSMAGRVVIAQSVLSAILAYVM